MMIGFGKIYRSKATETTVEVDGIDTIDFRICGTLLDGPNLPDYQVGLKFTIPVTNFIKLFEEV